MCKKKNPADFGEEIEVVFTPRVEARRITIYIENVSWATSTNKQHIAQSLLSCYISPPSPFFPLIFCTAICSDSESIFLPSLPHAPMAPTEQTILTSFLLPPARLPAVIALKEFTAFFPRSQQSSPQIKTLYRDLQHQRASLTDSITGNIAIEVKRGNAQRRAVVRTRRAAERESQDDEIDIEFAVGIRLSIDEGSGVLMEAVVRCHI